jgi:hypothetical protein
VPAEFNDGFVADQSKKIGNWSFCPTQRQAEFLHFPSGVMEQDGKFVAITKRTIAALID